MHNYFSDIMSVAEVADPHEMCGFLHYDGAGSMRFSQATNLSQAESFHAAPTDVVAAYQTPGLMAFVHSHCQNGPIFSQADIEYLNRTQLPWFIYSTKTCTFNFRRPDGIFPPFVGRGFIVGMHDCVGLAIDYYAKFFGLTVPFFVRTETCVNFGYSLDCVLMHNLGFEEVTDGSIRPHDLVMMRAQLGRPVTHVGVIVREDLLLHQLFGKISCIERYSGAWSRLTQHVFRHPKFTSKLSVL